MHTESLAHYRSRMLNSTSFARPTRLARLTLLIACLGTPLAANAQTVRLSFPATVSAGPITGRAYLFVARDDKSEPRRQSGSFRESEPFFGVDVSALKPGVRLKTKRIISTVPY